MAPKDSFQFSVESPEWQAATTLAYLLYGQILEGEALTEKALQLFQDSFAGRAIDVVAGDSEHYGERVLLAQCQTLQAAFNRWLTLASLAQTPELADRYSYLALRAQDQCRKSLLALHELRNPRKPTQFIKSYVDKQVNQLKVEQQSSPSTQSLEASPYAAMDTRSEATAARTDSDLATLEIEHRG